MVRIENMERFYELTYLASPVLDEKELEALQEKVKNFILELGGKIENELSPIKMKLGYPIQNFEEGFLVSLEYNLPPQNVEKLDQKIKGVNGILRHLIIHKGKRLVKTIQKEEEKPKKPKKVKLKELDQKLKEILEE